MNKPSILSKFALLTLAAVVFVSAPRTKAETIFGVTDGTQLFSFDSATPGTVTSPIAISGIVAGQTFVAMDFRPANGQLYGLSFNTSTGASQLYIINTVTAVATPVGSGLTLATGSSRFAFDFNPVVDRIRVITGAGANYRLDPNSGTLAATDTNVFYPSNPPAVAPVVAAVAYTNNNPGAPSTTLYGYDFANDLIVTVGNVNGTPNNPNSGQLFQVGASGLTAFSGSMGFDISGATGVGYLNIDTASSSPADGLYTVNLATGALTFVGTIGATSTLDISVQPIPEPSTVALLGLALSAGAVSAWRRRRA